MEIERAKLSLFQIEVELKALVEHRCDAQDRLAELEQSHAVQPDPGVGEAIHAVKDELTTVDGLIRAYIGKEVKKVDAIAHVLLELEARRAIHRSEARRLDMLASNEEASAKRIKEMVLLVMGEFGTKILEGAAHDLKSQGNGGVQALTISQPDMVPEHLRTVTLRMRADDFKAHKEELRGAEVVSNEPNGSAIRKILEGAEVQRKAIMAESEVLEKDASEAALLSCRFYIKRKLDALPGVPGCRLEPRGVQLRIR